MEITKERCDASSGAHKSRAVRRIASQRPFHSAPSLLRMGPRQCNYPSALQNAPFVRPVQKAASGALCAASWIRSALLGARCILCELGSRREKQGAMRCILSCSQISRRDRDCDHNVELIAHLSFASYSSLPWMGCEYSTALHKAPIIPPDSRYSRLRSARSGCGA